MRKNFIEVERDQEADCARIVNALQLAEQEFANLYRRDYDTEEARRKRTSIRDRTILAIRDVRHNIAQRAREAHQARARLIEKSSGAGRVRLADAATFDNVLAQFVLIGPQAYFDRLARISHLADELDAKITQLLCAQRSCATAPGRLAASLVPEDREELSSATTNGEINGRHSIRSPAVPSSSDLRLGQVPIT